MVLFAGPERGEGEVAHQLWTLTDIVSTRLPWLNLLRKMPQALNRDAFEILPRLAQRRRPRSRMPSIGARPRASASYALHRWGPTHPGASDRQASAAAARHAPRSIQASFPGVAARDNKGSSVDAS